jgi:putative ABC transport system permease protein
MVLFLVGLLLAVPILVSLVSHSVRPVLRRVFGIETRLAADNLLRAPGRTGVVVGALAAGVALMFQTASIGRSNEEPVLDWLDRVVIADLIVVCGDPMSSSSAALPIDPRLGDELLQVEGVADVMPVRYSFVEFRDRLIWVSALDSMKFFEAHRHHQSKFVHFEMYAAVARPGTALISENFAALYKVKKGETITIQGPNGPVALEIVDVIQDYSWSRGSILVDHSFFMKAFEDPLIDSYHVFFKDNADRETTFERVKKITDSHALALIERDEFDSWVGNMIRRMYMLAYLQQVAVGVVAALGVVMALLISVLQRRRELGLLRAVGSTQGQVLHTVVAEATLMGILGTILGLVAGVPLEWYILRVIIFEETGFIFPVTVPWLQTLTLSAVAIGVATFAGLFPALHAVRLRIAEAIQYE